MFFRRLNWNVVSWFRTVSFISYLIIAAGFGSMVWHGFQGGNGFQAGKMMQLGLSFTGGTEIDIWYQQPVQLASLRTAIAQLHPSDEEIRTVGAPAPNGGYVRYSVELAGTALASTSQQSGQLWSTLDSAGATVDRSKSQVSSISPVLGREYLAKAIEALIIALGIQFIYIAFRFGWNYIFGLVTVIALVRDAAMMIGIYALAGKKADDAFLAAVLTVIGYSVMDTIVILDRIRENTRVMAGQAYDKIVNTSILQTMTRSFNTLATVVITLVALLALGGASLKNFAFALLVGICSGGYHSIFFSAPLVLGFRKGQLERAARKRAAGLAADSSRSSRSVAQNRSLSSTQSGAPREDIVAARKARREKAKSARPAGAGPARYKRRRPEGSSTTSTAIADDTDAAFDEVETNGALEAGHEPINLNLDEFEAQQTLPPLSGIDEPDDEQQP